MPIIHNALKKFKFTYFSSQMLQCETLPGIYVIPSRESCLTWFGVIFIRSGMYEDGIFRFNILLPDTFPDGGHPKLIFQSDTYHPAIHKDTNELHLLDGFPIWDKTEHHIWQVLKYVHWIFYNFNSSLAHAVNRDLVDMYKDNQEQFKSKVKEIVKVSQERLYDASSTDDKHFITFEPYDTEVHDEIKVKMLTSRDDDKSTILGYSWVNSGSFKPLSRQNQTTSERDNIS